MRPVKRFFSRWQNFVALILLEGFIFIAIAAPFISPNDPQNPGPFKVVGNIFNSEPQPPSEFAPLGTLPDQTSVYHALVWGTRSAFTFGLSVALISAFIGVLIGAISAYSGGFLNDFLMRITDAFLAFPIIAAVVFIQQIISIILTKAGVNYFVGSFGDFIFIEPALNELPKDIAPGLILLKKIDPAMIAFILLSWVPFARVTNTVVMRVKKTDFIEAARAVGAGKFKIIFKHLIPNSLAPAIVLAARDVGGMVVLQATFAFIGLGEGSPWGTILVIGRNWIYSPGGIVDYWWVFLPATLAIVLFGIAWNLLGDGLNDALNPRSQ